MSIDVGPIYDEHGRRRLAGEYALEADIPAALRLVMAMEDGDPIQSAAIIRNTPGRALMAGLLVLLHSEGLDAHGSKDAFRNRLALTLGDLEDETDITPIGGQDGP
jgi:hypothetical protein